MGIAEPFDGASQPRPFCLISGVAYGVIALEAMLDAGIFPRLVIGYADDLNYRSGYVDLAGVASHYGIESYRTTNINETHIMEKIAAAELKVGIVCGWSQLLKRPILDSFQLGTYGFHPTPLPIGRGRAPIPWTLIYGLKSSAVSLLRLDEGVDSGPLVVQREFEITEDDDASTLYERVGRMQSEILVENLSDLLSGSAVLSPQVGTPTYWQKRTDADGEIDWSWSGHALGNWVRALTHPYPGAWTTVGGHRLRIWKVTIEADTNESSAAPGTVLDVNHGTTSSGLTIACGAKELAIVSGAQFDGEPTLSESSLRNDTRIHPGVELGK